MDLHTMEQVKRLFAWADANDDTRNMELHLEVAFRIVAEQAWSIERRSTMTREQLRERDAPKNAQVFMEPAYREQKARLGQLIAGALHCRFVWFGALNRVGPTPGYFVGSAVHVDRARLLYELIEPDLRLLTRFVGPQAGKGTGAGGAPSGDGMDFFHCRSWAMQDAVTWVGARLTDIEAGVAARAGLADDFRIDALNIDGFVDHLWRDAIENGGEAGAPDLPLVDGIPYGLDAGDHADDADDESGDDDEDEYAIEGAYVDDGEDEYDDFDYSFDFPDEDEDGGDDAEYAEVNEDDSDDDEWDDGDGEPGPVHPSQTSLFDADVVGEPESPAAPADPASPEDHGASGNTRPFAGRSVDELLDALSSMTDEDWARYNAVKDLWDEGELHEEDSA